MLGKIICDLAPKNDNPRNSEGAFLELKNGKIMFAYTHYFGDDGDDGAPAEIPRVRDFSGRRNDRRGT